MDDTHFEATYLVETPLPLHKVAEIMAGEQSCGTFTRVDGETDELRERAKGRGRPWLLHAISAKWRHHLCQARGSCGVAMRALLAGARSRSVFPLPMSANLSTLAATVAGNLFDLGEVTGLRLQSMRVPVVYRPRFPMPRHGVDGTRRITGVADGPMVGSIIKPNVGLSAADTGELVGKLCASGLDFIKDDEISANPEHAPLAERIPAVMKVVRRNQDSRASTSWLPSTSATKPTPCAATPTSSKGKAVAAPW
jgi:ribulose-bisphosphate carboxylase large chain